MSTAIGAYAAVFAWAMVVGIHDAGNGTYPAVNDFVRPMAVCGAVLGACTGTWLLLALAERPRMARLAALSTFGSGALLVILFERLRALPLL